MAAYLHHHFNTSGDTEIKRTFCLAKPGSITKTTPSIVSEVSAMLVDTTTFLPTAPFDRRAGGGSKMRCWRLGGRDEYRGMHFISPTSGPRLSISLAIRLHASSISYGEEIT